MVKRRRPPAPFPSQEEIVKFVHESPGNVGKREIARAFHMDTAQKLLLKKLLRDLELDGTLARGKGRHYAEPGILPNVSVVEEMVNLIAAQRAYEVNSKTVQTADEMLQISNNLKR